jgi:hypothetical protein
VRTRQGFRLMERPIQAASDQAKRRLGEVIVPFDVEQKPQSGVNCENAVPANKVQPKQRDPPIGCTGRQLRGNYKGGQNAVLRQLLDSDVGKAIVAVNGAGVHRVIRPGLSGSAP